MTIIEARGRAGQLVERHRCQGPVIRIGRAFDNDIILDDRYVSPHHLRLTECARGWMVEDPGSLNGYRLVSSTAHRHTRNLLTSGDSLRLGHITLSVYDDRHPVTEADRLGNLESRLAILGRADVWPGILIATTLIVLLTGYWNSFQEYRLTMAVQQIIRLGSGLLVIALFWGLVGRLLKHRAYFLSHLSLWCLLYIFGQCAVFTAEWVAYNANSSLLEDLLRTGLVTCLITAAIWTSLLLATNLHDRARTTAAVFIIVLFIALDLITGLQEHGEFSPRPEYYSRIMHPVYLLASPAEETTLDRELENLFERADAAVSELEQDDYPTRSVAD